MYSSKPRKKMSPINYGLFLLGRKDYGIEELRGKFEQHYRNEPEKETEFDLVINRFIELGYLDDQRYVAGYVRKEAARGQGPMKIRWALSKKKIDQQYIELALEAVDWFAVCLETLESRRHRITDVQKMMRFLASRGFSRDQIQDSLNKQEFNMEQDNIYFT